MQLKPLGDRLIIEAISEEELTRSGIILPETVDKERPERGKVISVGPGKLMENGQRLSMDVKVGDVVVFKKYSPDEVKIDDKEYLVISESDVLAVIES
jgi:chaperonin GroES